MQELAAVGQGAESLRREVARLAPLEALTGDLQRECSRLHDTSDMCAAFDDVGLAGLRRA